ncbi:MAG: putative transporter ATP-binding protein [Ilumatobacteraceae bacterium]|nr:putative transporter ATP-binding protein [Ilumatobacteraceae bacterium]
MSPSQSSSRHPKPASRHPKPASVTEARGTSGGKSGGKSVAGSTTRQTDSPAAAASRQAAAPKRVTGGALAANELTKDYGDRPALAPLTIGVPIGQRVAVVGHNGSGKTTFIRMAAGLLDPSGGTVHVMGHASGTPEARAALAYLSDTPSFYDDLSLWEHLEYVARLHGVEEWDQVAADLLGHLGLYDRADDLPNTFSRGLRQKAAIALAFVRPFEVLLVDEPFVGLDSSGKTALLELLDQAEDDGATLIVATHELTYVDKVTRLIALRDGELVHDGEPNAADVAELVMPG